MATSCTTTATGTTTSLITLDSITTSFSETTTTDPATTTTITTADCALGILSNITCLSTTSTITSTILGATSTLTIPLTETVPVTSTTTITLFGSSCTVIPTSSGHESVSVFTPPPTTIVSQSSSTLANGQVTVVVETVVSTLPLSVSYVPTSSPGAGVDQTTQTNTDGSAPSHVGPIVGGVVAGFFGLLGLVFLIWFIMKRRRRWDDAFDEAYLEATKPPRTTMRFSLDGAVEPKPYHYGLVGKTRSPSIGTPPNSPPRSSQQLPGTQHKLAPLTLPTTASMPGLTPSTMSSRPSTAGSMRPLHDPQPSPPPPSGHNHTTSSGSSTSVRVPTVPMPRSQWAHHSPGPSADEAYMDHLSAAVASGPGSPTSVQGYEFGKLHLANVRDGEAQTSPLAAAGARASARVSTGPALLDGKGRNVRLGSGGAGVLLHTDGGPAPPGYNS